MNIDDVSRKPGRTAFPPPVAVQRAAHDVGTSLSTWRRLRGLTAAEVAERSGISRATLSKLEAGSGGTSLENTLRVARALGVMTEFVASLDPYASDLGRLRSEEQLPLRVRHRKRQENRDG